jgi:hypothetical protein
MCCSDEISMCEEDDAPTPDELGTAMCSNSEDGGSFMPDVLARVKCYGLSADDCCELKGEYEDADGDTPRPCTFDVDCDESESCDMEKKVCTKVGACSNFACVVFGVPGAKDLCEAKGGTVGESNTCRFVARYIGGALQNMGGITQNFVDCQCRKT